VVLDPVQRLMRDYPRIFFACHTEHVRDPSTQRVVSAHQASILDHLDEHEPTSLSDLAGHMGVTPSTMSLAIDRLVRKGHVSRERDARDRRRSLLRVSTAGLRVREARTVLDPTRVSALLECLSRQQREEALRGLAILAEAGDELVRRRSRRPHRTRTGR